MLKSLFIYLLVIVSTQTSLFSKDKIIKAPIGYWPPFAITDKMPYRGIDVDLLKEIEKRLAVEIRIKKYPWTRSLSNMKQGKLDIISGIAKREERAEYLHYIPTPYYTCSTVFYVKKGNSSKIKKYDDLYNYSIGYVEKSAYFLKFDKDKKLKKRAVTREIQLLKMLKVGRIDTIIGTDCQVDYELAQLGYNKLIEKAEFTPGNNVHLYVAVSKKSPYAKELDTISEVVKNIVEERKVKEFAKKYYE